MSEIARLLGPLSRRIMLMVGRGTLSLTDDAAGQQRMQVSLLDGETRDVSDRVQQYGLSSHPPAGSHVVVINVGGQRDHPLIIGADDPSSRPTNQAAGEVMLWSVHAQRIHMQEDGTVLIRATKLRIEAPLTEIEGDVTVTGDVTAGTVSLKDHRHSGVEPGSGLSGAPQP